MTGPFVCIRLEGGAEEARERALAEAMAAGATGGEERDGPPAALLIFAPAELGAAVRGALTACSAPGLRVGPVEPVVPIDWSAAWREGLAPIRISERLVVCPSFTPCDAPRACQVRIDPGQAFGTGSHGSTRRALEWVDRLGDDSLAGAQFLDLGCGSGVLALAALVRGAAQAVACDLDPVAVAVARANAQLNGQADRVRFFVGSVQALRPGGFDVAAANLLRTELLPVLPGLLAALRPGGRLVLSGLLAEERSQVEARLVDLGGTVLGASSDRDETGDEWLGLLVAAPPAAGA